MTETDSNTGYSLVYWKKEGGRQEEAITEQKCTEILTARQKIIAALDLEMIFAVFVESFVELEKFVVDCAIDYQWGDRDKFEIDTHLHVAFNVKILAVLTSIRSYHDYRGRFSKILFELQHDIESAERFFNDAYDRSFEYRFVEVLRNYSQHNGLPISKISFQQKNLWENTVGVGPSTTRVSAIPLISKEKILSRKQKLKPSVMRELNLRHGDSIGAMPYLRKYVSELSSCHFSIRELLASGLSAAEEVLIDFPFVMSGLPKGSLKEMVFVSKLSDGKAVFIGRDLIDRRLRLCARRTVSPVAYRSYASTQVVKSKDVDYGGDADLWIQD